MKKPINLQLSLRLPTHNSISEYSQMYYQQQQQQPFKLLNEKELEIEPNEKCKQQSNTNDSIQKSQQHQRQQQQEQKRFEIINMDSQQIISNLRDSQKYQNNQQEQQREVIIQKQQQQQLVDQQIAQQKVNQEIPKSISILNSYVVPKVKLNQIAQTFQSQNIPKFPVDIQNSADCQKQERNLFGIDTQKILSNQSNHECQSFLDNLTKDESIQEGFLSDKNIKITTTEYSTRPMRIQQSYHYKDRNTQEYKQQHKYGMNNIMRTINRENIKEQKQFQSILEKNSQSYSSLRKDNLFNNNLNYTHYKPSQKEEYNRQLEQQDKKDNHLSHQCNTAINTKRCNLTESDSTSFKNMQLLPSSQLLLSQEDKDKFEQVHRMLKIFLQQQQTMINYKLDNTLTTQESKQQVYDNQKQDKNQEQLLISRTIDCPQGQRKKSIDSQSSELTLKRSTQQLEQQTQQQRQRLSQKTTLSISKIDEQLLKQQLQQNQQQQQQKINKSLLISTPFCELINLSQVSGQRRFVSLQSSRNSISMNSKQSKQQLQRQSSFLSSSSLLQFSQQQTICMPKNNIAFDTIQSINSQNILNTSISNNHKVNILSTNTSSRQENNPIHNKLIVESNSNYQSNKTSVASLSEQQDRCQENVKVSDDDNNYCTDIQQGLSKNQEENTNSFSKIPGCTDADQEGEENHNNSNINTQILMQIDDKKEIQAADISETTIIPGIPIKQLSLRKLKTINYPSEISFRKKQLTNYQSNTKEVIPISTIDIYSEFQNKNKQIHNLTTISLDQQAQIKTKVAPSSYQSIQKQSNSQQHSLRLIQTLTDSRHKISSIAINQHDNILFTGSYDYTLRCYEQKQQQFINNQFILSDSYSHHGRVQSIEYCNNDLLFTAAQDGVMRLFQSQKDLNNPIKINIIAQFKRLPTISSMYYSKSNNICYFGAYDGTIGYVPLNGGFHNVTTNILGRCSQPIKQLLNLHEHDDSPMIVLSGDTLIQFDTRLKQIYKQYYSQHNENISSNEISIIQRSIKSEYKLLAATTEYYNYSQNQLGSCLLIFDIRKNLITPVNKTLTKYYQYPVTAISEVIEIKPRNIKSILDNNDIAAEYHKQQKELICFYATNKYIQSLNIDTFTSNDLYESTASITALKAISNNQQTLLYAGQADHCVTITEVI